MVNRNKFVYKRYLRLKFTIRFYRMYFRFTKNTTALITLVDLFQLISIYNIKKRILNYVLQDIYMFVTKKLVNNFKYDDLDIDELGIWIKACNNFFLNNRMFIFFLEDHSCYVSFIYNNIEDCNFDIGIMHENQKDLCIMGHNKQNVEKLYNAIKRELTLKGLVDTDYDYEYNW